MRILRMEIEEFGKLSDKLFVLGEGLNLIEGPNESGKSTLLAFLRFIFYGFPRKAGVDGEEREKRLSWRGQRAAGRLMLRTEKGDFCIARAVARQGSAARESFGETLCVTSLTSGEEVALGGMTPGEYFLGLPATLYDSTLCLRQSDAAHVSDPAVSEAVSELLFTGSMGVSADAAMDKLQLARRELQHKKGRGGQIADLSDRIEATQDALLRAREDSAALTALRADVERYQAQLTQRRAELERVSLLFEQSAIWETLTLFERAHEAEALCAQKKTEYEALYAQHGGLEHVPEVLSGAQEALHECRASQTECERVLPELTRLRSVHHNEQMLAANAILAEKGGAAYVLQDFQAARQKQRRARKTAWIFTAIALVFATVTGLIVSGAAVPLLNLFLPTGDYLPGVCVIGALIMLLLVGVSVGFFLRAARFGRRVRAWMKRLGVKQPQMFRTYLEQSATEAQTAEAHRVLLSELEGVYAEKYSAVLRAQTRVRELLSRVGVSAPEKMEDVPALLADLNTRYRAAYTELGAAKLEWERAHAAKEALAASLAGKNEAELRARFAGAGAEDIEELRRKQAFLKESLAGMERKSAELARRESALAATVRDPAQVEAQLSDLRAQHKRATRRLSALELAIDAMDEAVTGLREGLLPKLCEKASAHLTHLTGGAYQKLYPTADLCVSLDSEKGPLPLSHFSAGCRDAAHLALRLGLLDTLCEERLPLLFDEAFSRLDDDRAYALLQLLWEYTQAGGQCLLFTCHTREAAFLASRDFTHFELQ